MLKDQVEILLVEDDPEDLELTLRALGGAVAGKNTGQNIEVARDGEEALDFLFCRGPHAARDPDHQPKLILLDLKLPKVDGLEVLARIKRDPSTSAIPVVILTSSKHQNDILRGYQLGANSYVQKPIDFDEFQAAIRQLACYWMLLNLPPSPAFEGGSQNGAAAAY